MRRAVIAGLILTAGLAGCADQQPPRRNVEQAAIAGCRKRADVTFLKQNRAILSERDTSDSPFSSTGLRGVTSEGLGDRYGRDQQVADCIAGVNGGNTGTATIDSNTGPAMSPHGAPMAGSAGQAP